MELKRIDSLWHFFATQNDLFLKKEVVKNVSYKLARKDILIHHCFNPKFPLLSKLSIQPKAFGVSVASYVAEKKRFGIHMPAPFSLQKPFFPREVLQLSSAHTVQVDRDKDRNLKVTLIPFLPKNIHEIRKPVNQITSCLWGFKYFSELVKN